MCSGASGRRATLAVLLSLATGFSAAGTGPPAVDVVGVAPGTGAEAYFLFAMAKMAQREQRYDAAVSLLKEATAADPTSATLHAELSRTYLMIRDYPAAEEAARTALELDPDNASAHTVLAQLYYSRARRGIDPELNRDRAMEELEASLSGGEDDDPEILLTLGKFYFEAGDYAKAGSLLQRFVELHPNPAPSALFLYARTRIHLEQYDESEAVLRQVLELTPDSLQALETLVNVKRLQEDFEGSIPLLQRILSIQGGDAGLYKKLGDAFYRTGRFHEAIEMLEMARREEPGSPYTLYYLGLSQERVGRLSDASATFEAMLERDPDNAEVLFRLARVEEQLGQPTAAVERYRRLTSVLAEIDDPEDPRRRDIPTFCARTAVLLMEIRRYDDAAREIQRCRDRYSADSDALDLLLVRALVFDDQEGKALTEVRRARRRNPEHLRFAVMEGEVMLHMRRDEEGRAHLKSLLQEGVHDDADSGDVTLDALVSDAYFNVGARAERQDDLERAETYLRLAIETDPDNSTALNYLGYTWADNNHNLAEALELLQRAVALDPHNGAYQDSLGWAYFRLGRLVEARTHLQKAAELLATDPTILEHLGDLEAAAGNRVQAERHWRRALDLGAENSGEIQRKLAEDASAPDAR